MLLLFKVIVSINDCGKVIKSVKILVIILIFCLFLGFDWDSFCIVGKVLVCNNDIIKEVLINGFIFNVISENCLSLLLLIRFNVLRNVLLLIELLILLKVIKGDLIVVIIK